MVADIFSPEDARAAATHAMEMQRDPSHVRFLRVQEIKVSAHIHTHTHTTQVQHTLIHLPRLAQDMFAGVGLTPAVAWHALEGELSSLLSRSFASPAALAAVRAVFERSADTGEMSLPVWRVGSELRYVQPMVILTATVPQ